MHVFERFASAHSHAGILTSLSLSTSAVIQLCCGAHGHCGIKTAKFSYCASPPWLAQPVRTTSPTLPISWSSVWHSVRSSYNGSLHWERYSCLAWNMHIIDHCWYLDLREDCLVDILSRHKCAWYRIDFVQSLVSNSGILPTKSARRNWTSLLVREYRQSMKMYMAGASRKSTVEMTLALLVESGVVYCCLWVGYLWRYLSTIRTWLRNKPFCYRSYT